MSKQHVQKKQSRELFTALFFVTKKKIITGFLQRKGNCYTEFTTKKLLYRVYNETKECYTRFFTTKKPC